MSAIDWKEIVGGAVQVSDDDYWSAVKRVIYDRDLYAIPKHWTVWASAALATRVPQACQTCEGDGIRRSECGAYRPGACPDCPTVAKLLAIGAAVMHGIDGSPPNANHVNQDWWIEGWEDAQVALRAVEP